MASIRRISAVLAAGALLSALASTPTRARTTPPEGSWVWPVRGSVIRGFEPPPTPFSPGHRGIDIAAPFGTPVRAPADGVVSFTGIVAGAFFVTIDHADAYRSTSSWIAQSLVERGQVVRAGDVVALSGHGHPDVDTSHLHFGVRHDGEYVDPLPLLAGRSVVDLVRLAPLDDSSPGPSAGPPDAAPGIPPSVRAAFVRAFLLRDRVAAASLAVAGLVARDPPRVPLE